MKIINKNSAELKAALDSAFNELEIARTALESAVSAEPIDLKALKNARERAAEVSEDYNEANIAYVYATCYENENPMLAACKYGAIVRKAIVEKVTKSGKISVEIKSRKIRNGIDLVDFNDRYAGKGNLCRNGQWVFYAEALAKALATDTAKGLELTDEAVKKLHENYKDAIAEGKWVCRSATSPSIGNITKDLQDIVDMILFKEDEKTKGKNSYKVFSKDARFLLTRVTKAGSVLLSTRAITGKEMTVVIGDIMYHLTTGNPYTME